jgi:hypothetical protein
MQNKHEQSTNLTTSSSREVAAVFAAIEKINGRLDKIEKSIADKPKIVALHPSQERFAIAEAVAEQIFEGIEKEKTCTFEPNGRPCDHCSMCSARGF